MGNLFEIFKISIVGATILIFLGNLVQDVHHYSSAFMKDKEIKIVKRIDEDSLNERAIASVGQSDHLIDLIKDDLSSLDKNLINGSWLVYEKTDSLKKIEKVNIKVSLFLNEKDNNQKVKIIYDIKEQYIASDMQILYFRIAGPHEYILYLAHDLGIDGQERKYDFYEAKKVTEEANEKDQKIQNSEKMTNVRLNEIVKEIGGKEYSLASAIPNGDGRNYLQGDLVQGTLKINAQKIEQMFVSYNNGSEEVTLEIQNSEIVNNYFQYHIEGVSGVQAVSGVINQFGESEYIVTLINGPLVGTKLKFIDSKKLNETSTPAWGGPHNSHNDHNHHNDHNDQDENDPPSILGVKVHQPAYADQGDFESKQELQNQVLSQRYEQAEVVAEGTSDNNFYQGFQF